MKPTFFATAAAFRAWLEEHHETESELWVGFHKKGSGLPSITWPEAVDQALCYGWIDGVRKSLDETSYVNRFTPRRPRSKWSAVNLKRFQELRRLGLVRPAGLGAFERGGEKAAYSYEDRRAAVLDPAYEAELRADAAAWEFFSAQAPWYRRTSAHWVMSAKREETRRRRLAMLIEDSANGRRIGLLDRPRNITK